MLASVNHSEAHETQSAPCTPQQSSEKTQDDDEQESDDDDDLMRNSRNQQRGPTKKIICTRLKWTGLGQWDRNKKIDFEINTERTDLATAYMTYSGLVEWPTVKSNASKMRHLGIWAQVSRQYKNNDGTSVDLLSAQNTPSYPEA